MSYLPHIRARASTPATGTVLMQMVTPTQLKVEIFRGKTAAEVDGFDSVRSCTSGRYATECEMRQTTRSF